MPRGKAKKADAAKSNGATITKWDAVKEALADLGNGAMPMTIQKHIQEKHGLVLDPNLISNYKSTLLKQSGGKKAGGKRKGNAAPAKAASASNGGRSTAGGIDLDDIRTVKQLLDRMGADKLKELAQVLGK